MHCRQKYSYIFASFGPSTRPPETIYSSLLRFKRELKIWHRSSKWRLHQRLLSDTFETGRRTCLTFYSFFPKGVVQDSSTAAAPGLCRTSGHRCSAYCSLVSPLGYQINVYVYCFTGVTASHCPCYGDTVIAVVAGFICNMFTALKLISPVLPRLSIIFTFHEKGRSGASYRSWLICAFIGGVQYAIAPAIAIPSFCGCDVPHLPHVVLYHVRYSEMSSYERKCNGAFMSET